MSGPRDLRRGGAKPFEKPASRSDIVGAKSHFTVERWGQGWAVNVHRRGQPVETKLCASEGEVNRLRRQLSDDGLVGVIGGGR